VFSIKVSAGHISTQSEGNLPTPNEGDFCFQVAPPRQSAQILQHLEIVVILEN